MIFSWSNKSGQVKDGLKNDDSKSTSGKTLKKQTVQLNAQQMWHSLHKNLHV